MIEITENTFCEIFKLSLLRECTTLGLYTQIVELKDRIKNEKQREEALKELYDYFIANSGTFEQGKYKNMSFITFMNDIIGLTRESGNPDFTMNDLKTCLFYFFLTLHSKDENRWIKKEDLKNALIGKDRMNFVKTGGNFKGALKLYLDYYFDNKETIKIPSDVTPEERKNLLKKIKAHLEKKSK